MRESNTISLTGLLLNESHLAVGHKAQKDSGSRDSLEHFGGMGCNPITNCREERRDEDHGVDEDCFGFEDASGVHDWISLMSPLMEIG